jgi:hypothetical protein
VVELSYASAFAASVYATRSLLTHQGRGKGKARILSLPSSGVDGGGGGGGLHAAGALHDLRRGDGQRGDGMGGRAYRLAEEGVEGLAHAPRQRPVARQAIPHHHNATVVSQLHGPGIVQLCVCLSVEE